MEDIIKILLAVVVGYVMFVITFYYLAKFMFPEVELDEDYEKLVAVYRKSKPRTTTGRNAVVKKFDPAAFKLSHTLKHRINYNKV